MKTARCHYCNRFVPTVDNRYQHHLAIARSVDDPCPMSYQRAIITGVTPPDFYARAVTVGELAEQVRDGDPSIVWQYLTALSGAEVQRMLMVALAAIPVDRSLTDIFGWVCDLPAAKQVAHA